MLVYSPENAERFLNAFNKIENFLRRETNSKPGVSFVELVSRAAHSHEVVNRYKDDLKEFAQLRNAIVHQTTGQPIAIPVEAVVKNIERIAEYLMSPPRVVPIFRKKVFTMYEDESVQDAIISMYRRKYSQIPIYSRKGDFISLLTVNTITMWLGTCMDENILNLRNPLIRDVLDYDEEPDNHCFIDGQASLFDVLDLFYEYQQKGKRLEAVLITQNGRASEKLLGIITIWDLPEVKGILNL